MSELNRNVSQQRIQTLQEWSMHLQRLRNTSMDTYTQLEFDPQSSTSIGFHGGNRKDFVLSKDYPSSSTPTFTSKATNFEKWISHKQNGRRLSTNSKPVPITINKSDLLEVEYSFQLADRNGDGWIDTEEFKIFMELRKCPITHWEARKVMSMVDPHQHNFISFQQLMYIVNHCGLTTTKELSLSSEEFQRIILTMRKAIPSDTNQPNPDETTGIHCQRPHTVQHHHHHSTKHSHRGIRPSPSTVLQTPIPMDNSKTFFQQMANEVEVKEREQKLYEDYRQELRQQADSIAKESMTRTLDRYQLKYNGPPGWKHMILHSQDPNYHVEPIVFSQVRKEWEEKSGDGEISVNGITLEEHKSNPGERFLERKGLSSSNAVKIPGRPQPFIMTQDELDKQLKKIYSEKRTSNTPTPPAQGLQTNMINQDEENESEDNTQILFKGDILECPSISHQESTTNV